MPRRRKDGNADLPHNLYPSGEYYMYTHPRTGKSASLGKDRGSAIAQAKAVNAELLSQGIDYTRRDILPQKTIGEALKEHRQQMLKRYKKGKTRNDVDHYLSRIDRLLGHLRVDTEIHHIHSAMSGLTDHAHNRMKMHLERLYRYCYRAGYLPLTHTNPATVLEIRETDDPSRERLTLNQYKAIHAEAPDYLKTAMSIMLFTTLRPADVVNLTFDQYRGGCLWVKTQKTGKALAIRLSQSECAVIEKARASDVASRFIVHRLPQRRGRRPAGKDSTQLTVAYLSTEFKRIRNRLLIGGENPPTLYEIRSLGGRLYEERGRPRGEIQALYGHTDQGMTDHYLDDRIERYSEVSAGLEI